MESREKYALRVCGPMLTQNLDPMDVLDDLLGENWLSESEYDEIHKICSNGIRRDAAIELLRILRPRPPGAFECFVRTLEFRVPFLAAELRKHYQKAPEGRRREHSLTDLREILIDGDVPDLPLQYVRRRKLFELLTNSLRTLANHLRAQGRSELVKSLPDLTMDEGSILNGQSLDFSMNTDSHINSHPPPTNAWLLVHGMAGCGKTVLCASALRGNASLLSECFPGGIFWLDVGPLTQASYLSVPTAVPTETAMSQLIVLIDRLERKISPNPCSYSPHSSPLSQSPVPCSPLNPPPSTTLQDSLDRLRRSIKHRQQRNIWGPDAVEEANTSLVLIVLDNVWDVQVIRSLRSIPAAFMVISRDREVLQHMETPVDRIAIYDDLTPEEIAQLLSNWTKYPAQHFLSSSHKPTSDELEKQPNLQTIVRLCRGLPFAVTLVGHLLREQYHRLSEYVCYISTIEQYILNWTIIARPSAYGFETIDEAIQESLVHISSRSRVFYEMLVIFDASVIVTPKVASILWSCKENVAENILNELSRYSLAIRLWCQQFRCYGFLIHAIQLDLLKLNVDPVKQASYHARFVENYRLECGGRWSQLTSSSDHLYFWNHSPLHLFNSGQLDHLADLLTDLEFVRGRLTMLGSSPVIAEFNRYRVIFSSLGRMEEWHAYLHFVQTNAYFIIDPTLVQASERGRSPYRKDTRFEMLWRSDNPSPVLPPATTTENGTDVNPTQSYPQFGPKGIDLIQLGLGLPQTSPVFQQAVHFLRRQHQLLGTRASLSPSKLELLKLRVSKYYWFWCNSHVAASQLLWALPTGSSPISYLTLEVPPTNYVNDSGDESGTTHNGFSVPVRNRRRFLSATKDGRVFLLDTTSGYEVAVQQTYSSDVEVKFLSFYSDNTECIACGSNGGLVISTLPKPEPMDRPECLRQSDNRFVCDTMDVIDVDRLSPSSSLGDLMGGLDVDDDDDLFIDDEFSSLSSKNRPSDQKDALTLAGPGWADDNQTVYNHGDTYSPSAKRNSVPSPSSLAPNVSVKSPTVLAKMSRLTEVIRVDGSRRMSEISPQTSPVYDLKCIAAPANLDIVVIGGQGSPDPTIHRADSPAPNTSSHFPVPILSVWFLNRSHHQLFLDCSRRLYLPIMTSETPLFNLHKSASEQLLLTCVSEDSNLITAGLSNGYLWIYSLDALEWITCISTGFAVLHAKDMERRLLISSRSGVTIKIPEQSAPTRLQAGPSPSCCIFLPPLNETYSEESKNYMLAAAVSQHVFIWTMPESIPKSDSQICTLDSILVNSKPSLCLHSSCGAYVLSLDACILADQRLLAGGTTNGHVLFWRVSDGSRLFELSAHANWVTCIRLLPPDAAETNSVTATVYNLPIGVITASADGVIKRWNVGAACLPSPTTPLSTGPIWPSLEQANSTRASPSSPFPSTALHGLWTQIFSVWFGPNGTLLVVGRRRHSTDIQFLFRPEQSQSFNPTDNQRTFQEVTLKTSQPFFWRPSKRPIALARPRSISVEPSSGSLYNVPSPPKSPIIPTRLLSVQNKHWINAASSSQTIQDRVVAITFWPCGHWLAVGLNNGSVLVFSVHFDDTRLFGVVKRFRLIAAKSTEMKLNEMTTPPPSDRILHLHTWQSKRNKDDSNTLVVLAVLLSGSVIFWHIPSTKHGLSDFDSGVSELPPSVCWPSLHFQHFTPRSRQSRTFYPADMRPSVVTDMDANDSPSPITWSTLHRISNIPSIDPSKHDSPETIGHARSVLGWLTAGRDGSVYGRQLVLPTSQCFTMPVDEEIQAPNRRYPCWSLDLDAHRPSVITSADIDPTGYWLITGSTDKTAKVWSLNTSTLLFQTAPHPACVRTVCFRPIIEGSTESMDAEWFIASGDDSGSLRIWSLSPNILQDSDRIHSRYHRTGSPIHCDFTSNDIKTRPPFANRLPSPGFGGQSSLDDPSTSPRKPRLAPIPPLFHSNAAGFGGSWLRCLVWSPDGRLLAGLSDRLCVWPFDIARSDRSRKSKKQSIGRLQRCRVLRVLSSGVTDGDDPSNILHVSCERNLSSPGNRILSDLPPSLVTVDANTGTLYIFDPIDTLLRAQCKIG